MKAFIIVLIAIFIGLGLLAYFVWPFSGNREAEPTKTVLGEATFVCPNGPTAAAVFYSDDTMDMTIDGSLHQLDLAVSASGARYLNETEGLEFWEHQGQATVTIDGQVHTACVSGEADNRYVTEAIVVDRALSFTPPPGTNISVERETFYKIIFAGPENQYPALTDGYAITMTLLEKATSTDFEAFVEEERDRIEPPIEAELSPVEIGGHPGYAFTYQTALGTEATDTFLLMEDDAVAYLSVSAVGENAESYRADIDNVLESVALVEPEE